MMKRTVAIDVLVIAVALAGCSPFDQIGKDLGTLKGKTLADAIKVYGYPQDQKTIAGDTVYIWKNEYAPTSGYAPCVLRLIAGPDGRIKAGDVNGSNGTCRAFT
jgi:predicted small secreted protein